MLTSATLTQKRAVFPALSSREVTLGQMRKIGIHFIIYGIPPDTEVELMLCFSLRDQQRTMRWTHYRGLV